MVGIYKYENGLKFTGKVAASREEAVAYLEQKHGKYCDTFVGYAEDGTKMYEKKFYPWYREDAYEIIEIEVVGMESGV